ncbi:protein AF-9-like [Ptychodera flava]|uniref:protein AF-9-like n=1 Tax=Ptychodera flava TaxID=63121 RepID=UPI00396A463F
MTTQCVQVKLELGHRATVRKKPTIEGFTHDWVVFVRGPEGSNIQHFVDKVVFHLHDSFPKPKRVVKEPPYQVAESGYAGFTLPIEVYFKNKEEPKKVKFEYDLFLHLEGCPPVNHIRCEKLTFNNPTEDFRRKLIKAGGVGIIPGEPTLSTPPSSSQSNGDTSLHTKYMTDSFIKSKPYPEVCPPPALVPPKKQKSHSSKDGKSSQKASKEPKQTKTGGKEPKSSSKEKSSSKRPSSPSSEDGSKKKRKKSSSTTPDGGHKSSKDRNSSGEKVKLKEKSKVKSIKPVVKLEPLGDLFTPEAVVEKRHIKPKLPVPKKDLPPFDDEVSAEENDDASNEAHSPNSSISFSSLPVGGAGALRTMMAELGDENDDDDDQDIITPFQSSELSQGSMLHSDSESSVSMTPQGMPNLSTGSKHDKKKSPSHSSSSSSHKDKSKKSSSSSKKSSKNSDRKNKSLENRKSSGGNTEYLNELVELHTKLMSLKDRGYLQKVVDLIEETGSFEVTATTFDFDLCSLDKTTVKKLQHCLEGIA